MHARYALTFERGTLRRALLRKAGPAGLEVKADRSGLLLLADGRTPVVPGSEAIAVGQLFTKEGERLKDLGDPNPAPGVWGNFAMFAERPASIYRDPSGSIPVHHIECRNGTAVVSDAELAIQLGLLDEPRVDRRFVVHWLQFPYLRSARTGIASAVEILPGTRRSGRGGSWADELAWKPWDHAGASRSTPDSAKSPCALRDLAQRSIASQLRGPRLLLQLSGGINSSIIAACLAEAGIAFTAVNFATSSADGDERRYARAVAEKFGAALVEIREEDLVWPLERPAERKFRPGSNAVLQPLDRAIERSRRDLGLDILVDGGGGDNLFGFLTGAAPILDAFLDRGPAAAWRTAGDVANRADCSWWTAAGHAALRPLARKKIWREDRRLLCGDCLLPRPDPHPWLNSPSFARPGKRDHIASLVEIQHFLDRRISAGEAALHPLMAQPLLEFCLSVPSWRWVRGGIDRALAREAFADVLPSAVVGRRSKGSLQGLFERAFSSLRADIRELLQDGELRRLGIINSTAVDDAVACEDCAGDGIRTRLSEMAALELWLQSWRC